MTSEIDKLKHFHVENYSGTNFTDDLNDGEEFLYTTIRCKDTDNKNPICWHGGFVGSLGLSKKTMEKIY